MEPPSRASERHLHGKKVERETRRRYVDVRDPTSDDCAGKIRRGTMVL